MPGTVGYPQGQDEACQEVERSTGDDVNCCNRGIWSVQCVSNELPMEMGEGKRGGYFCGVKSASKF